MPFLLILINRFLLTFCFFLALALPAYGLNLTMPVDRYAESMEFYYQTPRPELITPLFRAFSEKGILANAEKRLFMAAFLAELIKKNDLSMLHLAGEARKLNDDAILTAAWAGRLSGHNGAILASLLNQCSPAARSQIEASPPNLSAWKPDWEKSVLNMYWGAFMATGNSFWLDAIIDTALAWARDTHHPTGRQAAASLYDYAPAHPMIGERLRLRIGNANPAEKRMLETILEHAEAKQ